MPRETTLAAGAQVARQRAIDIDRALSALLDETLGTGRLGDLALVAVGGYGRGELSPHSDIDLLFLLPAKTDVTSATLRGLLYPLWDAGWQVGHATRSPKEAIERSAEDLDAATAILTARLIGGSRDLFEEFMDRRARWIKKDARALTRRIADSTLERHQRADRAGWVLAPDLKEDVGALRDLHRLVWLQALVPDAPPLPENLSRSGETMLAVREALHAELKRKSDALHIDLQPRVAARVGATDANELMFAVHSAAREIEHEGEIVAVELAGAIRGGPRRSGRVQRLGHRVKLEDGSLDLDRALDPSVGDAVRLIAAHADGGRAVNPRALKIIKRTFASASGGPWDEETRSAFFSLLEGAHCTSALELLDHVGAWPVLVPEWTAIRALAQHDPYHRFTVDGHLFVVVAEIARAIEQDPVARAAAAEAGDLSTLLFAALLHDVGKGSGHDHSLVGEELARAAAERAGLEREQIEEIARLVRWHLLLVDTATRRDLDDGAVISHVADTVGDGRILRLLYILSVADGRGTGPEGWSNWKGALVAELYRKALTALETGHIPSRSDVTQRAREVEAYEPSLAGRVEELLATLPPSYLEATAVPDMVDDLRLLLQSPSKGQVRYRVYEGLEHGEAAVTICVRDRPGTLARTAGVLSLNRISVLRAQAFSTTAGLALERFVVRDPEAAAWARFKADLEAVYSGRLALEARLEKKIHDYGPEAPMEVDVRVLQEVSPHSSVIEVRSPDALGLLFALTAALTDLDLDIHVAKIDTLGARVVDTFYVRNAWAEKLTAEQCSEVERAIRHRIARLFG